MQPDPQKKEEAEGGPDTKMTKKHSRILVFVKGLLKGGVNAGLAADRAAAHMGIKGSKYRTGVVRKGPTPDSGPVKFGARFTAMPSRDELFNRLVALGPQTWKEY